MHVYDVYVTRAFISVDLEVELCISSPNGFECSEHRDICDLMKIRSGL
jgi:hypothetical protein